MNPVDLPRSFHDVGFGPMSSSSLLLVQRVPLEQTGPRVDAERPPKTPGPGNLVYDSPRAPSG
jgi:hypothetical protein